MQTPRVQLRLLLAADKTFGPGKADLLTLIQSLGSIAAAGREMKMSYKRAWDLVEEMNASFSSPLITTERGGHARGGAQVTELGAKVLAHYRMLEERLQQKGDPTCSSSQTTLPRMFPCRVGHPPICSTKHNGGSP
jgi:molybdate transport system regulatory protein